MSWRESCDLRNAELIDKCVGSRIWVIMKGDKGTESNVTSTSLDFDDDAYVYQNSAGRFWASMTTSVRLRAAADNDNC